MAKSKLPKEATPDWLRLANKDMTFDRERVLTNSIYYPGSYMDGNILKDYSGVSHSFVYVDPGVSKDNLVENLQKIAGYDVVFSKEITEMELCPQPEQPEALRPSDFENPPRTYIDIQREAKRSYERLTDFVQDFKPYAIWSIFQRRASVNPSHGPERFSLLFIAGEGVATYAAIYNSNKLVPLAIVLCAADIGFGRNWAFFEQKDGIFERVVMANKAGIPKYLFAWSRYSLEGTGSSWRRPEIQMHWAKYTNRVSNNLYGLTTWSSDDAKVSG